MVEKDGLLSGEERLVRGDRLDLKVLLSVLRRGKKRVVYTTVTVFVLTVFVALLVPNRYEAVAVILPKSSGASQLDGLGGLASLAGVNLNSMVGETSELSPDVYPALVYSYPFIKKLSDEKYTFQGVDRRMSFAEREVADSALSFSDQLVRYTIRLPWTIMDLLKKDQVGMMPGAEGDLIVVTKREAKIYQKLHSMLSVDVNNKTGLVSVKVEAEESFLAAEMAQNALVQLQEAVIRHQTSQVANNLAFVEERFEEQREELQNAQRNYFEFLDANRNRVAERTDLRQRELNDSYTLALHLYQSLAEQVQQAKIAVKKETPAFSIIEPVRVPFEKSYPKRSLWLFFGLVGGLFLGLLWVLALALYLSIRMSWERDV